MLRQSLTALLIICPLWASTVTVPKLTINGKEYTNATLAYESGQVATLSHDAGSTRVPLGDIPDDLKQKLGITPKVIEQVAQEQKAKQAAAIAKQKKEASRKALIAQATEMHVEVIAQHPAGLLVSPLIETEYRTPPIAGGKAQAGGGDYIAPGGTRTITTKVDGVKYVITGFKNPSSIKSGSQLRIKTIPDGYDKHGSQQIERYKCVAISGK